MGGFAAFKKENLCLQVKEPLSLGCGKSTCGGG
jgi:hypothetical protein